LCSFSFPDTVVVDLTIGSIYTYGVSMEQKEREMGENKYRTIEKKEGEEKEKIGNMSSFVREAMKLSGSRPLCRSATTKVCEDIWKKNVDSEKEIKKI
jgi:hypothetical protein